MFYTLYNISWGIKRPQRVFKNYTVFCNKNLYTDKIGCFLSNFEINNGKSFKKNSYGLFHNHKFINQLSRKNIIKTSIVLAVSTSSAHPPPPGRQECMG